MSTQTADRTVDKLLEERIVAVVRLQSQATCLPVARALVEGGVRVIEMTMTTPGAVEAIPQIQQALPEALVGAGSVLTEQDVDKCLAAGAAFLVGPVLEPTVVQYALSKGVPFSPGTFTPSEAYAAHQLGAPLVKVFPAARLGPKLISDLRAPMPFLRLMPTGGITAETVEAFLAAGAAAVGAGSWLTPKDAVIAGRFDEIRTRAAALREAVDRFEKAERRT